MSKIWAAGEDEVAAGEQKMSTERKLNETKVLR